MPEENNNQQKAQYLKRDEVRTMEKDIARLREQESEIAREKISQIKTEEEIGAEADKLEQLKRATEEREKMELETKRREEEAERAKGDRAAGLSAEAESDSVKAEGRKESLMTQLKETQTKEEEERKKFIENISAKAEGLAPSEGEPPAPSPIYPRPQNEARFFEAPVAPPLPAEVAPIETRAEEAPAAEAKVEALPRKPFKFPVPKIQLPDVHLPKFPTPKVTGYFPGQPSIFEKIWIRIIVSLFILAILATLITFWYWYLVIRPAPAPIETPIAPPAPVIEQPKPVELLINEKILQFGYHIPPEHRTIDTIIIHSVYNALSGDTHSIEGVIEEYKTYGVAAHYLIARDGKIYQTAPKEAIAYHAGVSQMPDGRTNVNNFSIGIELIYTKEETPTETQYQSLSQLVKHLQKEYDIPIQNILGHKDIAPDRKDDPWNFNWNLLDL